MSIIGKMANNRPIPIIGRLLVHLCHEQIAALLNVAPLWWWGHNTAMQAHAATHFKKFLILTKHYNL